MANRSDWLPGTREGQLAMVKDWISVVEGKAAAWLVPAAALTGLGGFKEEAETALDTARNETTRTPVATARCREAFEALAAGMRDFKRRYFLEPPLSDADLVSLGLKPPDRNPTPGAV
ncbi:MAG: hypothetical protein LBC88_00050, partial [Spirochaetaceae bacterium]|nr:hypothetical protein [Spirochaetaceae bacterium]